MEKFLLEASFILGVSQVSIENDYYMRDIPELIQMHYRKLQSDKLAQLQTLIASNGRNLEEKAYDQYIKSLLPPEANVEDNLTFNRDKFEQLRRRR